MTTEIESRRLRISGLLIVDKPILLSSMGAISRVRGRSRGVRTGHAGTLDPLATGVLVIGLGRATKQLDQLMGLDKRYQTTIDLSRTTPSFDLEMEPESVEIESIPDRAMIERSLAGFVGECMQAPPAFSAIKVNGKRSYTQARKQQHDDLPPRPVQVHALEMTRFEWPEVDVEIHCGKGFYVRALARDLGRALGCGGVCTRIHRSAIGPYNDEMALHFDDIPDPIEQEHLQPVPTDGA
ncbi:MAG: tRNA pseudouridine(55) synthase TruB [Phycisphaerae bacterium]|nr:tRNA pseudouridine(55) synthase TruB [Phycisphaerae bacterium]